MSALGSATFYSSGEGKLGKTAFGEGTTTASAGCVFGWFMIFPRVQKMGLFEGPRGEHQAELKRPAGLLVPGRQEVPLRAAPGRACVCQVPSVGLAIGGKWKQRP